MNITKQSLYELASQKQKEKQDAYTEQASTVLARLLPHLQESASEGYFSYKLYSCKIPDYLGKILKTTKQYELIQGKLADTLSKAPYKFTTLLTYELSELVLIISWETQKELSK